MIDRFHAARGYVEPGNLLNRWLQARREKVRQVKQNLMQQLLTGRVRLVQPSKSNEKRGEEIL